MRGLVFRVLSAPAPHWKEAEPPSLDNLKVILPEPRPLTGEDVLARLELCRQGSAVLTRRPAGALVQPGDLVQVSVVVFSGGQLVPFSAQEDLRLVLDEEALQQPPLAGLKSATISSPLKFRASLPSNHSAVAFRGKSAIFIYVVKAAWSRAVPGVDDPDLLAKLGLGKDAREAAATLQAVLQQEQAQQLEGQVIRAALDELVRRSPVEVPRMLFQKIMLQRWSEKEGKFLQSSGIDSEDCDAAFDAWLRDPELAADLKASISRSLVLRAVGRTLKLKLDAHTLRKQGAQIVAGQGLGSARSMEEQVAASDTGTLTMLSDMAYLEVIAEVRRRVQLTLTPPTSG